MSNQTDNMREEIIKRDHQVNERERIRLQGWANLNRILEAQQWEEWPSGDLLIRVRRTALVGCKYPGMIPPDACEITEVAPMEMDAPKDKV